MLPSLQQPTSKTQRQTLALTMKDVCQPFCRGEYAFTEMFQNNTAILYSIISIRIHRVCLFEIAITHSITLCITESISLLHVSLESWYILQAWMFVHGSMQHSLHKYLSHPLLCIGNLLQNIRASKLKETPMLTVKHVYTTWLKWAQESHDVSSLIY